MILWEKSSLDDREAIFEFLYEFNPLAAEQTDAIIEKKVENLKIKLYRSVVNDVDFFKSFYTASI